MNPPQSDPKPAGKVGDASSSAPRCDLAALRQRSVVFAAMSEAEIDALLRGARMVEVPAQYETITRQVFKTPATVRYEDVPAEYETSKKRVLKKPATTRVVEVPAEYAEVEVRKMVKPATTVTKVVPVDYEREVMVMVEPAKERRIPIPAEYAEREVTKLVAPAREVRVPVPAEYADVPQEVMVCPVAVYWAEVLCDVNATPEKIGEIQQALAKAGFYKGPINGKTDTPTMAAVGEFQKAKGLVASGFLDLETLKALGVSPK